MPLSGCFGPVWSSPIPESCDYVDPIYPQIIEVIIVMASSCETIVSINAFLELVVVEMRLIRLHPVFRKTGLKYYIYIICKGNDI